MATLYPQNYIDSRNSFRKAARAMGAQLSSYPVHVDGMPGLSIDVAIVGPPTAPAIVLSSGLHGVEGKVGAAVQIAWMKEQKRHTMTGRYLLIHALNPYGYSLGRRVNEDNIDLNRNFLDFDPNTSELSNSSDYGRFNALLNPACAPKRFDGFLLQSIGYLMREGKHKLQSAIVTGQYEYASGLFYGGAKTAASVAIIQSHIKQWLAETPLVCHLDFHTGLGRFSECQLLIQSTPGTEEYKWFEQTFGVKQVTPTQTTDSSAYQASGAMGSWLVNHFNDRPYRFVTAEFGTYSALKVLGALRKENQAFHFTPPDSEYRANARSHLERCFCPPSSSWRNTVLAHAIHLIRQAHHALYSNSY